MELILAFIAGIFIKLYDDIIDLKINTNNTFIFFLQLIITLLTIYAGYKYSIISVIIVFAIIISNLCKPIDNFFWYYYLILNIFLSIIFYKNLVNFKINYINISVILCFLFLGYYEENKFKNESTSSKTKSRCYFVICSSLFIFLITFFKLVKKFSLEFFVFIIIFVNAYFITNIIIKNLVINNFMKKINL